tara:strand:- start:5874 stop:7766 length:1893 start_codon:yes stop_codon:yes gene_type:complete
MSAVDKDVTKEVRYLGRDFDQLKAGLVDFTKKYYPNTYNDFNEASPGMMFIEMAAYVGDVLNYYIDSQLKESMILHARERKNVLDIAQAFGYKPKLSVPALVDIDVYQLLPPIGSGADTIPDYAYALKLNAGMVARSTYNNAEFIIQDSVDFSIDNYISPRTVTVAQVSTVDGSVEYYLVKKTYKAISAGKNEASFTIDTPVKFDKIKIKAENLIGIQSVIDSDNNLWYDVPYLAQDTIFQKVENTAYNDPTTAVNTNDNPYLLKLLRVPRRFVTRVVEDGIELQFGAGISTSPGEEFLPTPENIGLSLPTGIENTDIAFDTVSPVFTSAYGQAPANTTLTVTYLTGGGVSTNVPSNTITDIVDRVVGNTLPVGTAALNSVIINSLAVNNPIAASGGRQQETIDELRENTLAQFMSQQRAVTREDYILRAYAMPASFGSVAKAYITPDEQENLATAEISDKINNPLALNMYILGYDAEKRLTTANATVKENLKNYIGQYRMLTDSINIRDAFVINIGVNLSIIAYPSFNGYEVIANVISKLKEFFDNDRWQINEPIVYSDIYTVVMQVRGVQTISGLGIDNLNNEILGYSNVFYDTKGATKNGILYPSYDASIFEVKYPNEDIKVRLTGF